MNESSNVCLLALAALCVGLVGCANTRPIPYTGVESSPRLEPNPHNQSGRIPYLYSAETNWQNYSNVIVEPVVIYDGSDHQFKKTPEDEKRLLSQYLYDQVCEQLRPHYRVVTTPGPDTLRVKLTLTGADPTLIVLGTYTRIDILGMIGPAYNVVQSVRGKEGAFTGSVSFATEIFDSSTDRLLRAYVEKQYPNAMNIKASLAKWGAAKTGLKKGAKDLADQLQAQ